MAEVRRLQQLASGFCEHHTRGWVEATAGLSWRRRPAINETGGGKTDA